MPSAVAQRVLDGQLLLIAKAWHDAAYKRALLQDPKAVVEREFGEGLPVELGSAGNSEGELGVTAGPVPTIPIHPGAAAYFDGEQKDFFDRYGNALYYGPMLLGALASLAAALYALFGLAAWGVTALLFVLGWRRFWARPLPNPATKAAGIGLAVLSVPTLLSLALGRLRFRGDELEAGGLVGRSIGDVLRGRIGTTGAVLFALALVLLAVPLATQVSLGDLFLRLRIRFASLAGRLTVGWARHRDRRTKERLRRTVVSKHLEKVRKDDVSLDDIPFAPEDAPPIVREVPGPGRFSISSGRSDLVPFGTIAATTGFLSIFRRCRRGGFSLR